MILNNVFWLVLTFISFASANRPADPYHDGEYPVYQFWASNYREPYFTFRHAFQLTETLAQDLVGSALNHVPTAAVALMNTVYSQSPFIEESDSDFVEIRLDNIAGGPNRPFSYRDIDWVTAALDEFFWAWQDEGWVPTFDVRLRAPEGQGGHEWRGNVTQY